jgi:hypothetical protein
MKKIVWIISAFILFIVASCQQNKVVDSTENETKVANQLSQIWKEYSEAI